MTIAKIKDMVQLNSWDAAFEFCKNDQNKLVSLYLVSHRLRLRNKKRLLNDLYPYLADHPRVREENLRPQLNYFLKSLGWQRALQFGLTNKKILQQILRFMKNKYPNQYKFVHQKYIQKIIPTVHVESKLQKDDYFGPNDKTMISLADFGFTAKDYILLTKDNLEDFFLSCFNQKIVAIDSEWNPLQQSTLSIIQLATSSKLFLLDFLYSNQEFKQQFANMFRRIAKQPQIKIVGLAIKGDIQKIIHHFKLTDISQQKLNLIELGNNFTIPYTTTNTRKGISLKNLCNKVFSKKLDKTETMSNWDIRPLRLSQLHYCLLDAYICIQLYTKIVQKSQTERQQIYGKQLTKEQILQKEQKKRLRKQERLLKKQLKLKQKKQQNKSQSANSKINLNYSQESNLSSKLKENQQKKVSQEKIQIHIKQNKLSVGQLLTQFFFFNISSSDMKNIFKSLYTQIQILSEQKNEKPYKTFQREFIRVLQKAKDDVKIQKIIEISDIYKFNKVDLVYYEIMYYQIQRYRYVRLSISERIRLCRNMQYIEIEALDYYVKAFRLDQMEIRIIMDIIKNNINIHLWKGNLQNAFLIYELFGKPKQLRKILEQNLFEYRQRL